MTDQGPSVAIRQPRHRQDPSSIETPPALSRVFSPSKGVFSLFLGDTLSLQPGKFQPQQEWRLAADKRAQVYSKRKFDMQERLTRGFRPLQSLSVRDHVLVQYQHGKTVSGGLRLECVNMSLLEDTINRSLLLKDIVNMLKTM